MCVVLFSVCNRNIVSSIVMIGDGTPSGTITPLATPNPPPSARQQVTMELLQTEKNYVGILSTILKVLEHLNMNHITRSLTP